MSKKVFFDTETTDYYPGQIGQLSVIIEDGTEVKAKNFFMEVKKVSEGVEKLGRTTEFYQVKSLGKKFSDFSDEIYEDFRSGILIAHNERFDENFLSTEFWRENKLFTPEAKFCTMNFFRDICKLPKKRGGGFKNPRLEELVAFYDLDKNKILNYCKQLFNVCDTEEEIGFHDSRYDTTAMYVVFHVYQDSINGKDDWLRVFHDEH